MIGDVLVKVASGVSVTQNEIDELAALNFIDIGKPPVRELSQISENLGHVRMGSVICGTGDPFDTTSGNFNGMGIFNPPLSFTAGDYNLVGCNNGVLQAGISAVDGKFYAAAGDVILDDSGISIRSGDNDYNYYKLVDGNGTRTAYFGSFTSTGSPGETKTYLSSTAVSDATTATLHLRSVPYPDTPNKTAGITIRSTAASGGYIWINSESKDIDTAIIGDSGVVIHVDAGFNTAGIGQVAEAGYMLSVTGKIKTDTEVISPLFTGAVTGAASDNVLKAGDTMTGALTVNIPTATDNAPQTALTLRANVTGGAGSANGFGTYISFLAETATNATDKTQAFIGTYWVDATDATRKARQVFNISDAAGNREAFRIEADGAAAAMGFLGATAQARPTAYTQTYSTASRTHSAPTAATLTDNSGGTANTTLESIGTTYSQTAVRNNFADLAAMVNKNTADNLVLAKLIVQIIDDLQGYGLFA